MPRIVARVKAGAERGATPDTVGSGGTTVMVKSLLAVYAFGSVTSVIAIVNVVVPIAVGLPVIVPSEVNENPGGRLVPVASDHWYGVVPPVAVSVTV